MRTREGGRLETRAHATLLHDADGTPRAITAVCTDISGRLDAERRLHSAEAALRTLADAVPEGVLAFDHDGRVLWFNGVAERMLGARYGQLPGGLTHELLHAGCAGDAGCPIIRCRDTGAPVRIEDDVLRRADDGDLMVAYTASPFVAEDGRRGVVVVFTDISQRRSAMLDLTAQIDRLQSIHRVREALADDRLELFAQPILNVATSTVTQHELLVRMRARNGDCVPPADFIPAAESDAIIHELDRWVMRQAVALAELGFLVEVNVSARSVGAYDVLQDFGRALAVSGADPALVVVELTETAVLADAAAGLHFIEAIKALGCSIALDDFGTGYGGLSYLKRLPIDYLKIDREFIHDVRQNPASRHLVGTMVEMARGLGQKTVAEGAEDEETVALVAELGVDFVQGYAVGRPAPAGEVLGV